MWKEKLWQVFLVIILGFVLTMCNRSASNNKSLNAESTSTVTVESLPTITLANAGPNGIYQTMFCTGILTSGGVVRYYYCDASDDTTLTSVTRSGTVYPESITHDQAFAAGWKLAGPGCGTGNSGAICTLFHK